MVAHGSEPFCEGLAECVVCTVGMATEQASHGMEAVGVKVVEAGVVVVLVMAEVAVGGVCEEEAGGEGGDVMEVCEDGVAKGVGVKP